MDYRTKLTVTSGLLGVLTLTGILGIVFSQQSVTQREVQRPLIEGVTADKIAGIGLPGDIMLTKGATWKLSVRGQDFPASQERIDGYVKTILNAKRERLVGKSVAAADFGLDAARSVILKDQDGKVIAELRTGKTDADGGKVFVGLGSSGDVWETDRALTRPLDVDFNTWAELTLVANKKPADLVRASYAGSITASDKSVWKAFDLRKSGTSDKPVWTNEIDKSQPDRAQAWVAGVTNFRFGAFVGPGEAATLNGSGGKLVLEWGDNTKTEVTIGGRDAQNRYAATDGVRQFWINEWALGQILFRP